MTGVDLISPVHIARDEESIQTCLDEVSLVSRGVSPQDGLTVDVVVVGLAPSDVVGRNQEAVKVLFGGDHGTDVVEVREDGVARPRDKRLVEVVDDSLLHDVDGVPGCEVEGHANAAKDVWGHVCHVVDGVLLPKHFHHCCIPSIPGPSHRLRRVTASLLQDGGNMSLWSENNP